MTAIDAADALLEFPSRKREASGKRSAHAPFATAKNPADTGAVGTDHLPLEAILLAAGRSRRMGGIDKLLLAVDGMAMVRRSASLFMALGLPLTVVTGGESRPIADALVGLAVTLVANPDADSGQQSSVRAGLAATPLRAPGVVIALADQPLLTTGDILALAEVFHQHRAARIGIPRHHGQRGNPVILPQAIARRLREPGAPTPRAYIDEHPEAVVWFDTANDHFVRDIDTPDDAERLLGLQTINTARG